MTAGQVILLLIMLAVFFYGSILLYAYFHVLEFHGRLKKRTEAISMLLNEKAEVLLALYDIFKKEGVIFTKEDDIEFALARSLSFEKPNAKLIQDAVALLKRCQSIGNFLSQNNAWATKTEEYPPLVDALRDIDNTYRQISAAYNGDVTAYNYWIKIPLCGWLPFLTGFRKQEYLA